MNLQISGLKVDAGGEGSRGGKIIGHTSSGKPIYASHNHPTHKEFKSEDHYEAAKAHQKKAEKFNQHMKQLNTEEAHKKEIAAHKAAGGEGSGKSKILSKISKLRSQRDKHQTQEHLHLGSWVGKAKKEGVKTV